MKPGVLQRAVGCDAHARVEDHTLGQQVEQRVTCAWYQHACTQTEVYTCYPIRMLMQLGARARAGARAGARCRRVGVLCSDAARTPRHWRIMRKYDFTRVRTVCRFLQSHFATQAQGDHNGGERLGAYAHARSRLVVQCVPANCAGQVSPALERCATLDRCLMPHKRAACAQSTQHTQHPQPIHRFQGRTCCCQAIPRVLHTCNPARAGHGCSHTSV